MEVEEEEEVVAANAEQNGLMQSLQTVGKFTTTTMPMSFLNYRIPMLWGLMGGGMVAAIPLFTTATPTTL